MNKHTRSKSGLFLMELTIVILFFAITSAVCMQIFTTAKVKSDHSSNLSNAVLVAESVAESYKSYNGDMKSVSKYFNSTLVEKTVMIYYDKNWKAVKSKDDSSFVLILTQLENKDGKTNAKINISQVGGKIIYTLTVKTESLD